MNISRIAVLCCLLVLMTGCTHPLSRDDKKMLAKAAQMTITMAFIGAGGGGGAAASMSEGGAGTVAFGIGSSIALNKSIVMNLDKRQAELQQSRSATQGYLDIERTTPYQLHLYTTSQAAFNSGSDQLTPQIKSTLNDIATTMQRHADAKLIFADHTNSDEKMVPSSMGLAKRRSLAAIQYLQKHGVEKWRLETNHAAHTLDSASEKTDTTIHPLDIMMTSQLLGLKKDLDIQDQSIRAFPSTQQHNLIVKRSGRDRLKLTMVHQAAFKHGSSSLTLQGIAVMDDLVTMLKRHPYASVEITGHADDHSLAEENRQLSKKRAQTIADYLKQNGMNPLRIQSMGTGKAAYHVAGNHTQEDAYRRVEIIIANRLFNLAKYTGLQEDEALLFQSARREELIVKRPTVNKLNLILAHQASFSLGSAVLQPQAQTALKETITMLKRYRSSAIHVIGHAKEKNTSSADKALSIIRARIVADFLRQQGIADVRVDSRGMGRSLYAATAYTNDPDIFQRVELMIEARHAL